MNLFFYDTETTGMPQYGHPSNDPAQPHLLEVSACVVDSETRAVIGSLDALVRPAGWEIEPDAAAVHGITAELAADAGRDEAEVLDELLALWRTADVRLAYNQPFDARIVRIACFRYGADADAWSAGRAECIGQLARRAMGADHMPRLADAYRAATGLELEGAHRARADMEACRAVYWASRWAQAALSQQATSRFPWSIARPRT